MHTKMKKVDALKKYKWIFPSRFRRHSFGWRSQPPIQRIRDALSEIRKVSRKDPVLAAEGAILLLEKLSPALEHVDSSSGTISSAVNHAIAKLVPLIAKPTVSDELRQSWLERLWEALQSDHIPYIEHLGDFWGELCATSEIASFWVDKFIDTIKKMWNIKEPKYGFFTGTFACFSALYSAKRYEEIISLLEIAPLKSWRYRSWGVKALMKMNKHEEALEYAKNSKGLNEPIVEIARTCEEILLAMGLVDQAYQSYALIANESTTYFATFRAITKKYPQKSPEEILHRLIESTPGSEGKWFAAAKDAGFFDLAIQLVAHNPPDPRTLIRAAEEFAFDRPNFAMASGLASLRWIALGYGYEISNIDILKACSAIMKAAKVAGIDETQIKENIHNIIYVNNSHHSFVKTVNDYLNSILEECVP